MQKLPSYDLDILFFVPGLPFTGNTLKEKSLGGSETAAIYMAKALKDLGHNVMMFCNCPTPGNYDGVLYYDIGENANNFLRMAKSTEHDIFIAQRDFMPFSELLNVKQSYCWCHDLAIPQMAGNFNGIAWNVDKFIVLSEYHKKQYKQVYSDSDEFYWVSRNGIDLNFIKNINKDIDRVISFKDKNKIIYASRPERGLENLIGLPGQPIEQCIMGKLLKINPEIKLSVAGYDHTHPSMASYYNALWSRCDELPNVTRLGALTKEQLYKEYCTSLAYVYPSSFLEISCISAMEAMACGLPFIGNAIGALPETVAKGAGTLFEFKGGDGSDFMQFMKNKNDYSRSEENRNQFVNEILRLKGDLNSWMSMHKAGIEASDKNDWINIAKEWEQYFYIKFDERTSNTNRLRKHFANRGDIVALQELDKRRATNA